MKDAGKLLGGKSLARDRKLKGTRRDGGKDKLSGSVRLLRLLFALSWARQSDPGGEEEVSVLVYHGAADGAQGLVQKVGWSLGVCGPLDQEGEAAKHEPQRSAANRSRNARRPAAPWDAPCGECSNCALDHLSAA